MTNEDYIREAVRLADGFELTDEGFIRQFDDNDYDFIHFYLGIPEYATELNFALDALAAQLVRQVDALPRAEYEVFTNVAASYIKRGIELVIAEAFGKDRTMNTIRAIVDSKVLSDE